MSESTEATTQPPVNYDVDYFINKFSAIPEEMWTTGTFKSDDGRCCALGHCGVTTKIHVEDVQEALALSELFYYKSGAYGILVNINDNLDPRYPQPTPKQRILAALNDIKQAKLDAQYREDCLNNRA